MRKISQQSAYALENNKNFKGSNTEVENNKIYLFGNVIADMRDGNLYITTSGWPSNTTKDRLNALNGVQINTKAGQLYLNGEEWSGEWTQVSQYSGDWTYQEPVLSNSVGNPFAGLAMVAKIGDIVHSDDQTASNDWKVRMLKAGLENKGLSIPENWDTLSEQEKTTRLDSVIKELA